MRCLFIAGRTIKQGQQENMGKLRDEYLAVVSTLDMNPQDLAQLGLAPGMPVRVRSEWGEAVYTCAEGDLPPGHGLRPVWAADLSADEWGYRWHRHALPEELGGRGRAGARPAARRPGSGVGKEHRDHGDIWTCGPRAGPGRPLPNRARRSSPQRGGLGVGGARRRSLAPAPRARQLCRRSVGVSIPGCAPCGRAVRSVN